MNTGWFKDLFIDEAKSALDYHGNLGGSGGNSGGSVSDKWFEDGNTHIWISLSEGRTSPMLGVCPKGTVTVDWGDGSEPDTLTGTSLSSTKWTPNHQYAESGDYVITLTVDGEMKILGSSNEKQYSTILRHSSSGSYQNSAYRNAVRKAEIGNGATLGNFAFQFCKNLSSVRMNNNAIDGKTVFANCYLLSSVDAPSGIPLGDTAYYQCSALTSVNIPDDATEIPSMCFYQCDTLASINVPMNVMNIASSAFGACNGVRYYDFTKHTAVPSLSATSAFTGIATDCEILVPAALYDEWIAATNWATYAANIKAV